MELAVVGYACFQAFSRTFVHNTHIVMYIKKYVYCVQEKNLRSYNKNIPTSVVFSLLLFLFWKQGRPDSICSQHSFHAHQPAVSEKSFLETSMHKHFQEHTHAHIYMRAWTCMYIFSLRGRRTVIFERKEKQLICLHLTSYAYIYIYFIFEAMIKYAYIIKYRFMQMPQQHCIYTVYAYAYVSANLLALSFDNRSNAYICMCMSSCLGTLATSVCDDRQIEHAA